MMCGIVCLPFFPTGFLPPGESHEHSGSCLIRLLSRKKYHNVKADVSVLAERREVAVIHTLTVPQCDLECHQLQGSGKEVA